MGKVFDVVVITVFLLCGAVTARSRSPADVPNPKEQPLLCAPEEAFEKHNLWVCNPDHVLKDYDVIEINDKIAELYEKKSLPCGVTKDSAPIETVVVVIQKMPSRYDIGDFTRTIHNTWGVGDAECETGIVFVLSVGDRQMHISTGKGVKKILTNRKIDGIFGRMKPELRKGNIGFAMSNAVDDVIGYVSYTNYQPAEPESSSNFNFVIIFVVVLLFVGGQVLVRRLIERRRMRRRYQEREARLNAALAQTERGEPVPATMCPICLEDFPTDQKEKDEKVEVLYCGHMFDKECISDWLRRERTCPICRRENPREEQGFPPRPTRPVHVSADTLLFSLRHMRTPYYRTISYNRYQRARALQSRLTSSRSSIGRSRSTGRSFGGGSSRSGGGRSGRW